MQCSGWQCPICKRVLAPFVQECPCKGQVSETWTTTTGTTNEIGLSRTKKLSDYIKGSKEDITVYFASEKGVNK